jgi:hypothetical protein
VAIEVGKGLFHETAQLYGGPQRRPLARASSAQDRRL